MFFKLPHEKKVRKDYGIPQPRIKNLSELTAKTAATRKTQGNSKETKIKHQDTIEYILALQIKNLNFTFHLN